MLTPYFQLVPELNEIAGRATILQQMENAGEGYRYSSSKPLVLTEDCGCTD